MLRAGNNRNGQRQCCSNPESAHVAPSPERSGNRRSVCIAIHPTP
jgi:hypothetical protein